MSDSEKCSPPGYASIRVECCCDNAMHVKVFDPRTGENLSYFRNITFTINPDGLIEGHADMAFEGGLDVGVHLTEVRSSCIRCGNEHVCEPKETAA